MRTPKSVPSINVTSRSGRIPKSALLAGAALAVPFAAHADVTTVVLNQTISSDTTSGDVTYELQVNGVNEFLFTASFSTGRDTVTPQNLSGYVGTQTTIPPADHPTPLPGNTTIGPADLFQFGPGTLQKSGLFEKGPWDKQNGIAYLGVEFYIGAVNANDLHYGYISLSACTPGLGSPCNTPDPAVIHLDTFAYQNAANTPITTPPIPEPSTLPLLAVGAAGLAAFRARCKKAA